MATAIALDVNGRSVTVTVDDPQMPLLCDIELVDRPTDKPWGAGEPAAAVVPAAIANAIFDAIGVRLRSVPFTPAKVLAAIRAGS